MTTPWTSRPIGLWGVIALLAAVAAGCAAAAPATPSSATPPPVTAIAASPSASAATAAMTPPTQAIARPWILFQGSDGLVRVHRDGSDRAALFNGDDPPGPAHGEVSPDGQQVAFQAGVDGSWDIWIAHIDGSGARVLVDCVAPCIDMDAPAWSPDGTSVAYSRLEEHGDDLPSSLDVVEVATGVVKTVVATPSGVQVTEPRWSPDGRSLVVTLEDHRAANGELQEHPLTRRIAVIRLDDPKLGLTFRTDPTMQASYADWHPTDPRIVFMAGSGIWWDDIATSTSDLYVMNADGSDQRRLTRSEPSDPVLWMPSWSADGASILATETDRASRESKLVEVPLDGTDPVDLGIGGAHAREQRQPLS